MSHGRAEKRRAQRRKSCPGEQHNQTHDAASLRYQNGARGINFWPGPGSQKARLGQQLVDKVTREPVASENKGRGYEVGKGQYLPIDDEDLEAVQVESNHTIEIDKFVLLAEIDARYFDSPYYTIPNDDVGLDAFAVIGDAMSVQKMVGIGHVVLQKRERPIMLEPFGKGLRGLTLRYPYEVRSESEYSGDLPEVKIAPGMLDLAKHIVSSKAWSLRA